MSLGLAAAVIGRWPFIFKTMQIERGFDAKRSMSVYVI